MTIHPGADPAGTRPPEACPEVPRRAAVEGPLYPVGLVVRGRACLVVGGGKVAARKARALVECGAVVTVVAPEVEEALHLLSASAMDVGAGSPDGRPVDVQLRRYQRGEAAGYRVVVAATGDPDVDAAVYEDAEAAGVWVNAADDPSHCSFVLPAVWRTGSVSVAVSTDGTSPALASWLRTRVAGTVGAHMGPLADLLGEARSRLKEEGRPTGSVDWLAVLEGPVPALVAEGRLADARAAIGEACGWSGPAEPYEQCTTDTTEKENGGAP